MENKPMKEENKTETASDSSSQDNQQQSTQQTEETSSKKRRRPEVSPSERRTLYILGLPKDVTQRELKNMFAFWPGFCKVQMYDVSGESTKKGCFVLFESQQQCLEAKDMLHGYCFDKNTESVLHARLARKNLVLTRDEISAQANENVKRFRPTPPSVGLTGISGLSGLGGSGLPYSSQFPPSYNLPYGPNPYYPANGTHSSHSASSTYPTSMPPSYPSVYIPTTSGKSSLGPNSPSLSGNTNTSGNNPSGNMSSYKSRSFNSTSRSTSSNPPGTTLFLGNLNHISEHDLYGMISQLPGYMDHKFTMDGKGHRVAFVEFDSLDHSAAAMETIQSQSNVNIHVAYSKNPLNRRTR